MLQLYCMFYATLVRQLFFQNFCNIASALIFSKQQGYLLLYYLQTHWPALHWILGSHLVPKSSQLVDNRPNSPTTAWSEWTYTNCYPSCGGAGTQNRSRQCKVLSLSNEDCVGIALETLKCTTSPCLPGECAVWNIHYSASNL